MVPMKLALNQSPFPEFANSKAKAPTTGALLVQLYSYTLLSPSGTRLVNNIDSSAAIWYSKRLLLCHQQLKKALSKGPATDDLIADFFFNERNPRI